MSTNLFVDIMAMFQLLDYIGNMAPKCKNKIHFPAFCYCACYFFPSRVGMKNKYGSHTHQHTSSTEISFSNACCENRGKIFWKWDWCKRQSPVLVWSQLSNRTACCLGAKCKQEHYRKNTKVQTMLHAKVLTFCAVRCWGSKTSVPTVRCSGTSAKPALELLWHSWCLPFHVSKPS